MKNDTISMADDNIAGTYTRFPIVLTKGSGSTLWDEEGRRYTDFIVGIATSFFGISTTGISLTSSSIITSSLICSGETACFSVGGEGIGLQAVRRRLIAIKRIFFIFFVDYF